MAIENAAAVLGALTEGELVQHIEVVEKFLPLISGVAQAELKEFLTLANAELSARRNQHVFYNETTGYRSDDDADGGN